MTKKKEYIKDELTVVWDADKCVHSTHCWQELRVVFDPQQRPWINLEGASKERIIEQIRKCPSGALSIKGEPEQGKKSRSKVSIEVIDDGPYRITGLVSLAFSDGTIHQKHERVSLCRCGASQRKPFCDGSHKRIGFKD